MVEEVKKRRGGAGKARPLYILMQVRDDDGNVMKIDKDQVTIVACSRNAGDVLDQLDGDDNGVFYKKFLAS